MSTKLRSHGKSVVVWVLLAMLVLGLGGFGVTSFGGRIQSIGTVGETEISVTDYANALRNEMNAAAAQIGRPLSLTEARSLGLDRAIQARLFDEAALSEAARRLKLSVGDAEVSRQITAAQPFQGPDGKFDRETYRQVLRQQGLTEAAFEASLRADVARSLLQGAVAGGVQAPEALVQAYAAYLGETRDLAFAEIAEADLTEAVGPPDEAALKAYHEANIARFTTPETREISYVWLTPAMLKDQVNLDEASLRAAYAERLSDYVQPETRLLAQLVFPTAEEASAAMARVQAGAATLASLAAERGLSAQDIVLGMRSREELGTAQGDAAFAASVGSVVGPVETDLGPALIEVQAVEAGEETPFEEARADLEAELAMDRARRLIGDQISDLEDRLASGATLEEMDRETAMELGKISLSAQTQEGIAAYEEFRTLAEQLTAEDFPELGNLADGGVFAARLDGITPAAPIAFEAAKEQVAEAWASDELTRLKANRAQAVIAAVAEGKSLGAQGLLVTQASGLARGGFVEGAPARLADIGFATAAGQAAEAREGARVFVVETRAIHAADLAEPDMAGLVDLLKTRLGQSLGADMVALFARAAQAEAGLTLDSAAIAAVQAQMQ